MNIAKTSAIVAGSASGPGQATAKMLASGGARVTIFDMDEEAGRADEYAKLVTAILCDRMLNCEVIRIVRQPDPASAIVTRKKESVLNNTDPARSRLFRAKLREGSIGATGGHLLSRLDRRPVAREAVA